MNFVKGRDEFKKFGVCLAWFFIIFIFGFLVNYYIVPEFKDTKPDTKSATAFGVCAYILILIITCSIKSIKAGVFEAASSKTDSSPDKTYKIFYYGIEPYVRNKLGINLHHVNFSNKDMIEINRFNWQAEIQNHEKYHKCELKVYETIANRRFWSIFCPFIGTEVLNMGEIEDLIRLSK